MSSHTIFYQQKLFTIIFFPHYTLLRFIRSILRRQKKGYILLNILKILLQMIPFIRKDILKNYDGTLDYYHEDEHTYFYCNLRKKYLYIL